MPPLSDPRGSGRDPSAADIRHCLLNQIGGRRRTPTELLRGLMRDLNLPSEQAKASLRALVAAGELVYVFEHGRNFLEPSFDRPVRVSERIVLAPPERTFQPGPADVVIRITPGAAFGAGRHPTTRLALKGIDFVLGRHGGSLVRGGSRVFDIGTGSGVLAMAAVLLGIETGLAVDIDPCAVAEAKANVGLNGLSERIVVCDRNAETIDGGYQMVTANLRTPTLVRLAPYIAEQVDPRGALVISGIRAEECGELLCAFEAHFFDVLWRGEEQEWAGLALMKKC